MGVEGPASGSSARANAGRTASWTRSKTGKQVWKTSLAMQRTQGENRVTLVLSSRSLEGLILLLSMVGGNISGESMVGFPGRATVA
jgi:hypothetical protein